MNRTVSLVLLFSVGMLASCKSIPSDDFPVLQGDYFGQQPPGMTPQEFTPMFYSSFMPAFGSVFSPDLSEFYFVGAVGGEEGGDIMVSRKVNAVMSPLWGRESSTVEARIATHPSSRSWA